VVPSTLDGTAIIFPVLCSNEVKVTRYCAKVALLTALLHFT